MGTDELATALHEERAILAAAADAADQRQWRVATQIYGTLKVEALVAAVEAVLKLADKGYQLESHGQPMPWWDIDPAEVREAITSALTGKEGGDGLEASP